MSIGRAALENTPSPLPGGVHTSQRGETTLRCDAFTSRPFQDAELCPPALAEFSIFSPSVHLKLQWVKRPGLSRSGPGVQAWREALWVNLRSLLWSLWPLMSESWVSVCFHGSVTEPIQKEWGSLRASRGFCKLGDDYDLASVLFTPNSRNLPLTASPNQDT